MCSSDLAICLPLIAQRAQAFGIRECVFRSEYMALRRHASDRHAACWGFVDVGNIYHELLFVTQPALCTTQIRNQQIYRKNLRRLVIERYTVGKPQGGAVNYKQVVVGTDGSIAGHKFEDKTVASILIDRAQGSNLR